MKKNVSFMRKIHTPQEEEIIRRYLESLFDNDHILFKEMIKKNQAYLDGKRFTYIEHPEAKKKYRIMGNCIGPTLYVRDVLNIDDPDTLFLENDNESEK